MREQPDVIAIMLGRQFPKVETMLRKAADDITAFPVAHGKKFWSIDPPSGSTRRSSAELTLSASSPPAALRRLAGCVPIKTHDEWQVSERRYLWEDSMALIHTQSTNAQPLDITKEVATAELIASSLDRPREAAHCVVGLHTMRWDVAEHRGPNERVCCQMLALG